MSANDMKMYKGLDVLLSQYENDGDPHRLNFVYDEENDKSVTLHDLRTFVDRKITELQKEGLAEGQDEVSKAVFAALDTETFSMIPDLVNRTGYSKGKVQNRLTKLVNLGKVVRGEVTLAATGKTYKGYKKVCE